MGPQEIGPDTALSAPESNISEEPDQHLWVLPPSFPATGQEDSD